MRNDETTAGNDNERVQPGEAVLDAGIVVDGRFKIGKLVGRGGMCAVYEAEHIKLHRKVAIKLLHLVSIASSDAVARFQREAILASELNHPNIIEMYGFGLWNTRPYIAMEFVEGNTLTQLFEAEGPLPEERAVRIFIQICDALSEAHRNHIVHRDLKPSNVIVVGSDDQVKLVDFGIARLLPESGEEVQKLTQTGQVLGSFLYMSPEQCMGRRVDGRTDIYAFGCLMYKVLSGHTPFEAETPFELMGMHLGLAPSAMADVSDRMNTITRWCLQKEPDKRPQSMEQLKSILLGGDLEVTRAVEVPEPGPSVKANPRNRKLIWTAMGTVFLAIVFSFFVFVLPHLKKEAPTVQMSAEEATLLQAATSAEASKRTHDIAIANLHLCKYYDENERWKDADRAGQTSVDAFGKAGDLTSPDSLWASYYAALAKRNYGKLVSSMGFFIRLSEDLPNAPQKLKFLGALNSAECFIAVRRPHHAEHYFRRAVLYAKDDGEFGDLQQARLEFAQFLNNPVQWDPQAPKPEVQPNHEAANKLLLEIIDAGAPTPEDARRVQTAKEILAQWPRK